MLSSPNDDEVGGFPGDPRKRAWRARQSKPPSVAVGVPRGSCGSVADVSSSEVGNFASFTGTSR
jgi:hypothetical protein